MESVCFYVGGENGWNDRWETSGSALHILCGHFSCVIVH